MTPTIAAALCWLALASPPEEKAAEQRPAVAPASSEAALALLGIQLPEGLKAELFAAEPLLANPVAFAIDERGRFFVAETFRLHAGVTDNRKHMYWLEDDLAARTVGERVAMYRKWIQDADKAFTAESERVRLIEDIDGDGRADRASVFADGFNGIADGLGAGLLARRGDVYFTCIPDLWLLRDADGDGRADVKRSLHTGYGVHVAYLGHDLHGLRFGPDGKLYFSLGDRGMNVASAGRTIAYPDEGVILRCERDGSQLEVFARGLRNPQELAFNEHGDLFTGENNSDGGDRARFVHLLEGGDSGWRVGYQYLDEPVSRGPWNAEKLWYPRWDGQATYIVPPLANIADGPSGLAYDPGTGWPRRFGGRFFLCDFRGTSGSSGVHSILLRRSGATYEVAETRKLVWNLLATDCDFGPDGALYVSDWVFGWDKTGKGRIYRIFDPTTRTEPTALEAKRLIAEGMAQRPASELVSFLTHADMRVRQEAQFALAERGKDSARALLDAARNASSPLGRLHAIWGLGQIGRREPDVLEQALALLDDPAGDVRAQTAKVMGEARVAAAYDKLIALAADPEPRVRYFAAMSLARLGRHEALQPILRMIDASADRDAVLRHAGVFALTALGKPDELEAAAKGASVAVRRAVLLALRRLEAPGAAAFLDDPSPELVLEAARAIHDVPVEPALPALARVRLDRSTDSALARRVVNACFRLGGSDAALRLASIAHDDAAAEAIRVEAIEDLGRWGRAPRLDRVLGAWRPRAARPTPEAVAALGPILEALLTAPQARLCAAACTAAGTLGMKDAGPLLLGLSASRNAPVAARVEAIHALEALADPRLGEAAERALTDSDVGVRMTAQGVMARTRPAAAVPILEGVLAGGTLQERQNAVMSLAGIADPKAGEAIGRQFDKLLAGQASADLALDLLEAAALRKDGALLEKSARYESAKPVDDAVGRFRECLSGGDAASGRKVFYEKDEVSCERCHKADGPGGDVGPPLAGIGAKEKREYILESIVAPNAKVAKGFETVTIVSKDGSVQVGVLKDEDASVIRLASPEGTLLVVPKDAVLERAGGASAMPEDLIKSLTKRELRDLVEYLASLKAPAGIR